MSVLDVVVTAREVEGLRCPFTGDKIEVHMIIHPGSVVFCAPNAFTLNEPVDSITELRRRSTMRNGVTGVVGEETAQTCPYTGDPLTLRTFPDGRLCYVGGFNPRTACRTLAEFLYKVTMRDGVPTRSDPEEFKAEHSPTRRRARKTKDISVSQDTLAAAEATVEKAGLYTKTVRGADIPGKGDA